MIIFILILIAFLIILGFIIAKDIKEENCWSLVFDGFFTGLIVVVLVLCIGGAIEGWLHPEGMVKPIDVYRGNTELQVIGHMSDTTFVPEDSIVVFNENYLLRFVK